jgi:hypothetical protein
MRRRFSGLPFFLIGFVFIFFAAFAQFSPPVAEAQCGASTTSCKDCHEVNAKHPVNTSGQWHVKHAFGDFCAFCHGGDVQATQKEIAHKAMYYPLAEVKTSCQSCHPSDTLDRAKVYAVVLGVDLKAGSSASNTSSAGSGNTTTANQSDPSQLACKPIEPPGEKYASGGLLDYNHRYAIEVLGVFDTSQTGNAILAFSALALLACGAVIVWRFEHLGDVWRKARVVPDWRQAVNQSTPDVHGPTLTSAALKSSPLAPLDSAPTDLRLEALDAQTRASLERILAEPLYGPEILQALSRLDPALIDQLQNIDKKDRALLLAIVEQLSKN